MKTDIKKLIDELTKLRDMAHLNSMKIKSNGEIIPEPYRTRSEGYASAYDYCIMKLRDIYFTA